MSGPQADEPASLRHADRFVIAPSVWRRQIHAPWKSRGTPPPIVNAGTNGTDL